MHALQVAISEIKRLFSRRFSRIALAVVAIVPLLYGALYLWAFWDPYSRLDRVPVALVNDDTPTVVDGKELVAGDDLVQELLDRRVFAWHVVSQSEAEKGLANRTYYLALHIPSDFSASLATADTDHPHKARLVVSQREATNMLASQIGGRVFAEIRAAAAANASESYYDQMLVGYDDVHDNLKDAAKGADKLANGLKDAKSGAKKLVAGATTARRGASALSTGSTAVAKGAEKIGAGARKLNAGSSTLAAGLKTAGSGASAVRDGNQQAASGAASLHMGIAQIDSGASKLADSALTLAAGARALDSGVSTAVDKAKGAAQAAAQVSGGATATKSALEAYLANHPDAGSDPAFAQALGASRQTAAGAAQLAGGLAAAGDDFAALAAGSHQVADGSGQLAAGAKQLAGGTGSAVAGADRLEAALNALAGGSAKLATGVTAASKGASQVSAGSATLALGSSKLADGASAAASGSRKLAGGVNKLAAGNSDLAHGLAPAVSGSKELADGLASGAKEVPVLSSTEQSANARMMSDPVALRTRRIAPVANYGTGFSPYFIPLSLWIGAVLIFFVVSPMSQDALKGRAPSPSVALGSYWPAALLGAAQTVVMLLVLRFGLGLDPRSVPALYGFAILASFVFVAILQWLSSTFGLAGKFISIVLLMLQLTSSAGTYPLETLPRFFRAINPLLPMTYVVDGLRQAISGGDLGAVSHDALALLAFGAGALALSAVTAHLIRKGKLTLAALEL